MIHHIHYYLLDPYLDWWTEDATVVEGPYMAGQRLWPTAVVCRKQVYIFGGKDSNKNDIDSVSILDLETNTCRNGPPMSSARTAFDAVLLDEKRILLLGGREGYVGL